MNPSFHTSTKVELLPTNEYNFVLNWMPKQWNELLGP